MIFCILDIKRITTLLLKQIIYLRTLLRNLTMRLEAIMKLRSDIVRVFSIGYEG